VSATREAILNAAEMVFAEHGFDGARFDAIAQAADYNKSLIGQYFGDKLGLYAEVLKRADRELNALMMGVISPLLADEAIASDGQRLRSFIATLVRTTFDYLVDHPRLRRILTWEMAEGWQTYTRIAAQFMTGESDPFEPLFAKARSAGLLRSDFPAVIQLTLMFQACKSYLAFLPMYQMELPGEDVSSAAALARARERLVAWVVSAMMDDLPESEKANPKTGEEA
jgi:AcrR family transcriptional regulator